jgi:hypothetical protein
MQVVVERIEDLVGMSVHIPRVGVGVDATPFERLALFTPALFLFTEP